MAFFRLSFCAAIIYSLLLHVVFCFLNGTKINLKCEQICLQQRIITAKLNGVWQTHYILFTKASLCVKCECVNIHVAIFRYAVLKNIQHVKFVENRKIFSWKRWEYWHCGNLQIRIALITLQWLLSVFSRQL